MWPAIPSNSAERRGGIWGEIRDGRGRLIAGACASLFDFDASPFRFIGREVASDGRYSFEGLEVGRYALRFDDCEAPARYVTEWYAEATTEWEAYPVEVVADAVRPAHASLEAGGRIVGRVTTRGGPADGACVDVRDTQNARIGSALTDSAGRYIVGGLPTGDYRARVGDCDTREGYDVPSELAQGWYGGARTFQEAAPIIVRALETTSAVDVVLARGGDVDGVITAPDASGVAGACVTAHPDDVSDADRQHEADQTFTRDDGTYTMHGLAPGTYRIQYFDCAGTRFAYGWHGAAGSMSDAALVNVSEATRTHLGRQTVTRGASVRGRITSHDGVPEGACVVAYAEGGEQVHNRWIVGRGETGEYELPGLRPGKYRIAFRGCPEAHDRNSWLGQWWQNAYTAERAALVQVPIGGVTGVDGAVGVGGDRVTRVSGPDRSSTAIAISRRRFPAREAAVAVLARADDYPDALTATPLAYAKRGTMLLTPSTGLPPEVARELRRSIPRGSVVYLLGGHGALSPTIDASVESMGFRPRRLAGPTRFETAVAVADEIGPDDDAIIIDGGSFADAVVGGWIGAGYGAPLLLSDGDRQHPATDAWIGSPERTGQDIAIGGAAVRAYPHAEAIFGASREETAVAAAEWLGVTRNGVVTLARRDEFADALVGGLDAAYEGTGVLLTPRDALHPAVTRFLCQQADSLDRAVVFGGVGAVDEEVRLSATAAINHLGC